MPTAYPAELEGLDLHDTWVACAELPGRLDPFVWPHRMAIYRRLLEVTGADGRFGPDNRFNPLWGLMFQHQWQMRTGRLGPAARRDGVIDPDSPWGYGNYTLSVLPWLGAVRAGVVAARPIQGPSTTSQYDYLDGGEVPAEFEGPIEDWRRYFELVVGAGARPQQGSADALPAPDDERLRMAMWHAHKTCLDLVAPRTQGVRPGGLPVAEIDFLRGWCRMVDFLWAAAFPTHFEFTVAHGLDVLPESILGLPGHGTLSSPAADTTENVLRLARAGPVRTRVNLWLWRRAMRTPRARRDVLSLLDAAFHRRPDNVARRVRLLWLVVAPRPGRVRGRSSRSSPAFSPGTA
jgi:hypothetical protein